jgi:hypothetical protein
VDKRLSDLAELKAATLTHCEYCIDIGRRSPATAPASATSSCWRCRATARARSSASWKARARLAVSRTPVHVPDTLFAQLGEHFDDAQLVELTHVIALENYCGRFNLALGVGAAGFSEGMVHGARTSGVSSRVPGGALPQFPSARMKARSGSRNVRPEAARAVLGIYDDWWIAVYSLPRQRIEQSLRCSWSWASRGL